MRFSKTSTDDARLLIDESETTRPPTSSVHRDHHHPFTPCHPLRAEYGPYSVDRPSASPPEYIYTESVKAIGNNEYIEEKRLLKRASWSPAFELEPGLPPNGKRADPDPTSSTRSSARIRLRPKMTRCYPSSAQHHPQQYPMTFARPASFNGSSDRSLLAQPPPPFHNQSTVGSTGSRHVTPLHSPSSSRREPGLTTTPPRPTNTCMTFIFHEQLRTHTFTSLRSSAFELPPMHYLIIGYFHLALFPLLARTHARRRQLHKRQCLTDLLARRDKHLNMKRHLLCFFR